MKHLILFLFTSVLAFSFQAQALNLKGYVYEDSKGYSFIHMSTKMVSRIQPMNPAVAKDLAKLKSFDSLIGSGVFSVNGDLLLHSIDFVALRRLLGTWKAKSTVVNFLDYTRVSFSLRKGQTNYKYAMTPAEGNSWRIFFTDESSVVLGAVSIEETKAEMEIYDPRTGEISQRLQLQKVQ